MNAIKQHKNRQLKRFVLEFGCLLLLGTLTAAYTLATDNPPPITEEPAEVPTIKKIISSMEFWMSAMVLLFGLIVILFEYLVLTRSNVKATSNSILSIFSITLIVIGTIFLLTSAYSVRQIAPAMGLFGTIAGYLLGRGSVKKDSPDAEG